MYSAAGAASPWQANNGYSQSNGHHAYISVPTRNPYAQHSALPPPPTYVPAPLQNHSSTPINNAVSTGDPSTTTKKGKIDWPQPVRDYVNRCFAIENQIKGIDRAAMESKLRQLITEAAQSNSLHSWNWETMLLPQQIIQAEQSRAILGSHSIPPPFVPPPPLPVSLPPNNYAQPHGSHAPRKRKSSEMKEETVEPVQPPWRANKKNGPLEDRITASDKRQKLDLGQPSSKSNASLEQRRRRFEDDRAGSNSPRKTTFGGSSPAPSEPMGPVVGRSERLEKNYFRLTAPPKPDDVRPLAVLRQTLELLKKRWRQDGNYTYICDQFKSLRQDLTVQHIKNDFTTNVYEIHARIALEKGDLGEYNQCQTQLAALYAQGLGGHPTEFKAYRILYYIYTCNKADMNNVLSDLTQADKESQAVKHALQVRSALALGNYHQLFKLYLEPPNMGAYLMDMFIERERLAALACISKAYKPSVKLRFITEELAFESDEEAAQFILGQDGKELLTEKNGDVYVTTGYRLFEDKLRLAFRQVDIKGQI